MRVIWILFSIICIAATVGLAAYLGKPVTVSLPSIEERNAGDDLQIDRIRETVRQFSSPEFATSRVTSYGGDLKAAQLIRDSLAEMGALEVEDLDFKVVVPTTQVAYIEAQTPSGPARLELHPLWPNLARTSHTPPEGITGPIIEVGGGTEMELSGKRITGSVVVMDWDSQFEWLSVPEFGGKALLFRGDILATGNRAKDKILSMPADIPRYYVAREDIPALDALLAQPGQEVTIHCDQTWTRATATNILARITDGDPDIPEDDADGEPVIFHAYYDSISVIADISPGAEQACGAATLLELGRYFSGRNTRRPVYLLFTGGHGQALSGMVDFVAKLRFRYNTNQDGFFTGLLRNVGYLGKKRGKDTEEQLQVEESSLFARMGRPGLFVGLDISSRSDQYGIFCVGSFRGQAEGLIRHKYSTLGLNLAAYAKTVRTNDGATSDTLTAPFVDGVNLTLGRGWWTYFPFSAAFESEIPTLAGFPGVTLATVNDGRRYVDSPDDTFERMDFDLLESQITGRPGESAGLAAVTEAMTKWTGPFVSSPLEDKWAMVQGRVVWLDQDKNFTPNEPLINALVFMKNLRNDKWLAGTRGLAVQMTTEKGRFLFEGLIQMTDNGQFANCSFEAYGLADKHFLNANPNAMTEFRKVLSKGGKTDLQVEVDGSIIYALDMARGEDYKWKIETKLAEQDLNIVSFPCRAFSLMGLTDPRGYVVLNDLEILEAATKSSPFQYGQSLPDAAWGIEGENLVTLWANPTIRAMLTLGVGLASKRLVLVNNTREEYEGKGFVLKDLKTMPSMVLQGANDMWNLDEFRIDKLEANGVSNPRVREYHAEAKDVLIEAEKALNEYDYQTYRRASERAWALEGKAYGETLGMINNMIHGILFYLALLLPLSYCLERLLIASETIKKRIIWICVIFSASFMLLAAVHPAFRFTLTPFLVLLAFIILALVLTVSMLLVSRMDGVLQARKIAAGGKHEDQQKVAGIAVRAVDLGISNIRRRPQRGFLTGLSVVMVTFILLSFTSLVPTVSISRLSHHEGEPTYTGMLARERTWAALPNPMYLAMKRNFALENAADANDTDAVVAGRAWFFSDNSGMLSQIDLVPVEEGSLVGTEDEDGNMIELQGFTAVALGCFEPDEPKITGVGDTLVAGRWFEDEDEVGIILSAHGAKQIGYGPDDLGKNIRMFGQEIPLVGLFDSEKFDKIEDIDGEPLTPVDFVKQQQAQAAQASAGQDPADTLEEYIHHKSDQIAILPFRFGQRMNAAIRSIAVLKGTRTDVVAEAEGYAKRSNKTILTCDGEKVTLFAALDTSQMSAAWQIVIPLFLGFIMILGTMLGSVYERRREIFVYNSVGLSPTNVSSLFIAEAGVYAIVGAGMGYLLGQALSKLLQMTGLLSGLALNYTAGGAIFVTVLTMVIVVVSAIYPARQAFNAAVPDADKDVDDLGHEGQQGDTIHLYLPFVATPSSIFAMQAYMAEYLESIQGVTIGQLAVDNLEGVVEQKGGRMLPLLKFRAWMAPFDLGISHDAELRIVFREDHGVYQYHLTATCYSGDTQNWHRLTPRFVQAIRKQLLMWRILSSADHSRYQEMAEQIFGDVSRSLASLDTASADAPSGASPEVEA